MLKCLRCMKSAAAARMPSWVCTTSCWDTTSAAVAYIWISEQEPVPLGSSVCVAFVAHMGESESGWSVLHGKRNVAFC